MQRQIRHLYPDSHFLKIVHCSLNIYILFGTRAVWNVSHQCATKCNDCLFNNKISSSQWAKTNFWEQCHVTNDVIALRLIHRSGYMLGVISIRQLYSCWLQTDQVIWHWRFFSCKGFWEGFYYNYSIVFIIIIIIIIIIINIIIIIIILLLLLLQVKPVKTIYNYISHRKQVNLKRLTK